MFGNWRNKVLAGLLAAACAFSALGVWANFGFAFPAVQFATAESVESGENENVSSVMESAGIEEYSIEIVSKNVSYSDSLYILYAVANQGFERTEYPVRMLFWMEEQDAYTIENAQYIKSQNGIETVLAQDCAIFYSDGIAAKEMTDVIYCRAYAEVDGVTVYSDLEKYSVLDYVYDRRENFELSQYQAEIYTTMLDYGAAAQKLFGYHTERLANVPFYTVTVENGTLADGSTSGRYAENSTVTITANPAKEDYAFLAWVDETGTTVSDSMTAEVKLTASHTYTAVYESPFVFSNLTDQYGKLMYKLERYTGSATDLVVPAEVDGVPVYAIGINAFQGCNTLESVTISDGIVKIGKDIFAGCKNLKTIRIPASVVAIDDDFSPFYGSPALQEIIVDKANAYYESLDGNLYTKGCTKLLRYAIGKTATDFVVPAITTEIGNHALRNAIRLKNLFVHSAVSAVGVYAVRNCPVTVYAEVESQPEGWVANWNPDELTVVWGYREPTDVSAFEYTVVDNASVTITKYVGEDTDVVIPSIIEGLPVTVIGEDSFASANVMAVTISDSVQSIGYMAFYGCKMVELSIGSGVANIGNQALEACSNLQKITVKETNINYQSIDGNLYTKGGECLVQYAIGKDAVEFSVPDTVKRIGGVAFAHSLYLQNVSMPNTLTEIGWGAFMYCSNLLSAEIPQNVQKLYKSTFFLCKKLESVVIPDSLVSIGDYAFMYCESLANLEIPKKLTHVGKGAFSHCESLARVDIPDVMETIGDDAFWDCINLTGLVIPNSVINIGARAFGLCNNLIVYCVAESQPEGWDVDWNQLDFDGNKVPVVWGYNPTDVSAFEYTVVDESTVTITNYIGEDTEVVIPSIIEGLPVTAIGESAFSTCINVTSVVVPDCVIRIEDEAFIFCNNLETITLGSGVAEIVGMPFGSSGVALKNIFVDENNPYYKDLDGILFTKDEKTIVRYPVGRTETQYTVPDGVTVIGLSAFSNSELEEILLPDGLLEIGEDAFWDSVISSIDIPNTVTSIGGWAFNYTYYATEFIIPESVQSIGVCAFYSGVVMERIVYCEAESKPDGWDKNWYRGSSGNYASIVYWYSENEPVLNSDNSAYEGDYWRYVDGVPTVWTFTGTAGLVYTLNSEGTAYSVTGYEGTDTDVIIPANYEGLPVTSIGENAFRYFSDLASIFIPDGVTNIERYAFASLAKLTEIRFPETLTTIAGYAFDQCEGLTELVVPDSVTSLGERAFWGCSGLKSLTIGKGLTALKNAEFAWCSGLTLLVIPKNITVVGYDAFRYCTGLQSVQFHDQLTTIGACSFSHCSSLTSIVIPDSVKTIERQAFSACSALNKIVVGKNVTTIGYNAFENCGNLTSMVIPESVTSIGGYAFKNCSSLTSVVIPDSVTSIGSYAFAYCSKLTIYCEAESQPSGWDEDWNYSNRPVVWGYKS